jgi:hypothetical protein
MGAGGVSTSNEQATEQIAPPESAADVRRMLAETMAEVKARRMDPKVANTVAYLGTVLLRAYEAERASSAKTPAQSYVPLIYRSFTKDREPLEIYDYQTGKLIVPESPVLPAPASRRRRLPALPNRTRRSTLRFLPLTT